MRDRETLHKAIYNCTLCKAHGFLVKRVQPKWDPKKAKSETGKWGLIIGQSPGKAQWKRSINRNKEKIKTIEKSKNKLKDIPIIFTGGAGSRLYEFFKKAGFTEYQLYNHFTKTAVTLCYPGKSEGGDRKPSKKEIELCSPFLNQQIRLSNPSLIIPWGMVAIKWFFPKIRRLNEVVGEKLLWTADEKEYPVISLPHFSNASVWWKREKNANFLIKAQQELSQLREESCPQ